MSSKFRQQGIKYCQEVVKTLTESWQKFPLESLCRKSQNGDAIEVIQPVESLPEEPQPVHEPCQSVKVFDGPVVNVSMVMSTAV